MMLNINQVYSQVFSLTQILNKESLLKAYNFPLRKDNQVLWYGYSGISTLLKQDTYENIYDNIIENENFNFIFLDKAIIQMMYKFDNSGRKINSHRLSFYPFISSQQLGENPDEYEEDIFGLRKFGDLSYTDSLSTPIRFDFDSDVNKFQEKNHSYSHMTIGGYKNCRITVSSPLTPYDFMKFILKSFYYEKSEELGLFDLLDSKGIKFSETITKNESSDFHIKI